MARTDRGRDRVLTDHEIAQLWRGCSAVDAALAAADREPSGAEAHRARIGMQQVGGKRAALLQHDLRREVQCRAAHMHRAGAAMPVATLDRAGIRLDKPEGLNRQSQEIGGDLRKAGFVALAI